MRLVKCEMVKKCQVVSIFYIRMAKVGIFYFLQPEADFKASLSAHSKRLHI